MTHSTHFFTSRCPSASVPPSWVEALAAPGSGDVPTCALDFANGRYWANRSLVTLASVLNDPTLVTGNKLHMVDGGNYGRLIGYAETAFLAANATILIKLSTSADFYIVTTNAGDEYLWALQGFTEDSSASVVNADSGFGHYGFIEVISGAISGNYHIAFTHGQNVLDAAIGGVGKGQQTPGLNAPAAGQKVLFGSDNEDHCYRTFDVSLIAVYPAQTYAHLITLST